MDAELITKCGCRKRFDTSELPGRYIFVPLGRAGFTWVADSLDARDKEPCRTFLLDRIIEVAVYREVDDE